MDRAFSPHGENWFFSETARTTLPFCANSQAKAICRLKNRSFSDKNIQGIIRAAGFISKVNASALGTGKTKAGALRMRYETEKALICGLAHFISVARPPLPCDNETVFSESLIKPLWDARLIDGPDLDSLKTTATGRAALLST